MTGCMSRRLCFQLLLAGFLLTSTAWAKAPRVAILVGANNGWASDRPLQYAGLDAQQMAQVLTDFGGFEAKNVLVLNNPSGDELRRHFYTLSQQASAEATGGLFLFYYSGHADAGYLHLGGTPISMAELFDSLRNLPQSVKLGILDACKSGSIVNLKGGKRTATFEVNVENELSTRGLAVLTSSGADELSQETKALRGSIFTHHLVSGLRGAADANKDRKVAIAEAYLYASERTYMDTLQSPVGPQRPAFKFDLSGQSDVVLTELQPKAGGLQFDVNSPNCFVTDETSKSVVAEVTTDATRAQTVMLPQGRYVLKCKRLNDLGIAPVRIEPGVVIGASKLKYSSQPLSSGILKGSFEEEGVKLRKDAYMALEAGDYDKAAKLFDVILYKDFGDFHAFRGKAQALLLKSQKFASLGDTAQAQADLKNAFKAEPSLKFDPFVMRSMKTDLQPVEGSDAPKVVAPVAPPSSKSPVAPRPQAPRKFALGLSLLGGQGLFNISATMRFIDALEVSLFGDVFNPGLGTSVRYVPASSASSLFVGAGGRMSMVGAGLSTRTHDKPFKLNDQVFARQSTFDRVLYAEAGLQVAVHPLYLELGISIPYTMPVNAEASFSLLPVIEAKWFW